MTDIKNDTVTVGFSPRVGNRFANVNLENNNSAYYGKFIRGAESIIRGAFRRAGMDEQMFDYKNKLIPGYVKSTDAVFLFGAAADVADAQTAGLHSEVLDRIDFEHELLKEAVKNGKIVYGACGAFQHVLKLMFGLEMISYLPSKAEGGSVSHHGFKNFETAHTVRVIDKDSLLADVCKKLGTWDDAKNEGILSVNSVHKQGLKAAEVLRLQEEVNSYFKGEAPFVFNLTAISEDGLAEGVEVREKATNNLMLTMYQWHPEYTRKSLMMGTGTRKPTSAPLISIDDLDVNAAETTGHAIFDSLKQEILKSREYTPSKESREKFLEFVEHKRSKIFGVNDVRVKHIEEPYDSHINKHSSGAVMTH